MQEYYKIYFPYSKEYLLEQIKKTTKPLCISNQAYRDMALAAYKEEAVAVKRLREVQD